MSFSLLSGLSKEDWQNLRNAIREECVKALQQAKGYPRCAATYEVSQSGCQSRIVRCGMPAHFDNEHSTGGLNPISWKSEL